MNHNFRKPVVLAATTALLAMPTLADAQTSPAGADDTARARYDSRIHFLAFDHQVFFGQKQKIHGQVLVTAGGRTGALGNARVVLMRRVPGQKHFHRIASTRTTTGPQPKFHFAVRARSNAVYRVAHPATRRVQHSRNSTRTGIYRIVSGRKLIRGRRVYIGGRVRPSWPTNKVRLQRKNCVDCRWRAVDTTRTSTTSGYRFRVGVPKRGKARYRIVVPASKRALRSYSGVWKVWRVKV